MIAGVEGGEFGGMEISFPWGGGWLYRGCLCEPMDSGGRARPGRRANSTPCRDAADVVNTRRLIAQTNDGRFGVNRFRPGEPLLPQRESFFRSRVRAPRGPTEGLSLKYHASDRDCNITLIWIVGDR